MNHAAFTPPPPPTSVDAPTAGPVSESERIGSLDVLRGIALLGMFVVHFTNQAAEASGAGATWQRLVGLLFEGRFWTMFGILFGAGFAIQLRRAEAHGDHFVPRYLRRLFVLAAFGFITEAGFGYSILLNYFLWGVALLFVRKWSTRALIVLLLVCAESFSVYYIARTGYAVATTGSYPATVVGQPSTARVDAYNEIRDAMNSPHYLTVVRARIRRMLWNYLLTPLTFLPTSDFVFFLLGFLGVRLCLFERPQDHHRTIIGLMVFGAVSWAIWQWITPLYLPQMMSGTLLSKATIITVHQLIRVNWLSFTYIGAVLLLIASYPVWLCRLSAFAWTGRMALTNYMIQVAILDLTFSNYAFDASVHMLLAPFVAVALFAVDVAISRWWLTRFHYGPIEWIWRSATYARWQPLQQVTG
ncbi:MAG TPA: DUF418 domain-containing protein [archaeon]|nr:DUF418 domain-containing protein [archaeon]